MTDKHTPAPWVISFRPDGSSYMSMGDPHKGPHWQSDMPFEKGMGADEANARLIEAAPDLLDALENLTIAIVMGWDLDGVLDVSRAAISKARGQS